GSGVRESRGDDGRIQPSPARAGLGGNGAAARSCPGGRGPAAVVGGHRPSAASRLRRPGARRAQGRSRRQRLAGCRAFLGALAVRDPGDPETTRSAPARAPRRSTRITGGGPDRGAVPLRQPVPAAFPVLDGLASGTLRRRKPRPLAAPRALLPASPSFRECPPVLARLRA